MYSLGRWSNRTKVLTDSGPDANWNYGDTLIIDAASKVIFNNCFHIILNIFEISIVFYFRQLLFSRSELSRMTKINYLVICSLVTGQLH